MKTIWVVTLFPQYFSSLTTRGVVARAFQRGGLVLRTHLLRGSGGERDFKGVDDAPYGGGQGMVMRADVLGEALRSISKETKKPLRDYHVVFPSPRGKVWNHSLARDFSQRLTDGAALDMIFICGRYEGVDERFVEKYVQEEISMGDYVLSGGELAVMAILDSSLRLCPGVLGHPLSAEEESFSKGLLEFPTYTRPLSFEGMGVPEELTSGHHQKILQWRQEQSFLITKRYRPDLLRGKRVGEDAP